MSEEQPSEDCSRKELVVNVTGILGLSTMGVGLWWVSPAVSLIVVGGLMLAGSVWGATR